ncbi:hypothetical protein [Rhizomonospora bruguierae]|uniref:hypothetical protein n=1 Tax=Rhizomonospora bruguierae TaxID=1581705 RepID=UPI001BCF4184|nr:hypothetical protein [Micromonospora sp. NBRC 107566]
MNGLRIIDAAEIRRRVGAYEAVAAVRRATAAHARALVTSPDPWLLPVPAAHGEVHVRGAHLHESPYLVVRVSSGFYDNPDVGLPTGSGLVTVLDASTGRPTALLLDGGYLTELRAGAAGALAADLLAPAQVSAVAMLGTGGQARFQLEALLHVRRPDRLLVYGRDDARADRFAWWARARHTWQVEVVATPRDAVRSADLVVTATPATQPLIEADWLAAGTHVTAVGADDARKRELHPGVLAAADVIACDDPGQSRRFGELKGLPDADLGAVPVSLGAILIGAAPGRTSDTQLTIADLTGLGAQDAALAELVLSAID